MKSTETQRGPIHENEIKSAIQTLPEKKRKTSTHCYVLMNPWPLHLYNRRQLVLGNCCLLSVPTQLVIYVEDLLHKLYISATHWGQWIVSNHTVLFFSFIRRTCFGLKCLFWTILDHFDHFSPSWTILDLFGPFWTILDNFRPFWPFWTSLDQFGPF